MMRRTLHFNLLPVLLLTVSIASAQNDRFAYAITDITKEGSGWNALRKLDLKTGEYSSILLNGIDAKTAVYDAGTKKGLEPVNDARFGNSYACAV